MDYESDSSSSSMSSLDVDYGSSDYESEDSGHEDNIEELRRKVAMFKKRLLQK